MASSVGEREVVVSSVGEREVVVLSAGEREVVVSSIDEREVGDVVTAFVSPSVLVTSSAMLDVESFVSSPEEQRELLSLGAAIASLPSDLPLYACVATLESVSLWCS